MGIYLFIGGPWDQEWRAVPDARDVWRVPVKPDLSRVTFTESTTIRPISDRTGTHLYYRRRGMVPGWLVPLTFYVSDPVLPPPVGTWLPGFVQGARTVAWPCGAWRYIDPYPYALHEAVPAFNARRLAR